MFTDLFLQAPSPPAPLHIQLIPHSHSGEAERAVSPVVVVSDPLSTTSHELPLRADSAATATTATLRVKEELKRSASSPQVKNILNSGFSILVALLTTFDILL